MSPPEDPALPTTHDLSLAARQQRGRIWIDGCFDFAHHGHAGAMLQARQLGTALYVGVHSDEAITVNKGPPVMALDER
jgi:ethanolamine-phosphate cytidylyltransferase